MSFAIWLSSYSHRSNAVYFAAAAAAKSLQSCPTLCDPIDGSPPGSPFPRILQARTLEWVAISFSTAWKWKVKVKSLSRVRLLATPWTAAHQAPPSMGFSRQEYWSGVPLPFPAVYFTHTLIMHVLQDGVGMKVCNFWVMAKDTLSFPTCFPCVSVFATMAIPDG